MANATVEIYRIPTPASDADVVKYSHLRLNALRTNPEAYTSTYERDVHLTHEQWRGRLDTAGRTTLAARTRAADADAAEWVGTLSVLHPLMLMQYPDDIPHFPRLDEAVKTGTVEQYLLVGMWVHPSARRQGVGRMLIQDALELVGESEAPSLLNKLDKENAGEEVKKAKVVFLKVFAGNEGARKLYRQAGFVEETEYDGEPNHIWMSFTL